MAFGSCAAFFKTHLKVFSSQKTICPNLLNSFTILLGIDYRMCLCCTSALSLSIDVYTDQRDLLMSGGGMISTVHLLSLLSTRAKDLKWHDISVQDIFWTENDWVHSQVAMVTRLKPGTNCVSHFEAWLVGATEWRRYMPCTRSRHGARRTWQQLAAQLPKAMSVRTIGNILYAR